MTLQDWATFGTAIAAVTAAVLSWLNLRQGSRREQLSWRRSALEGASVDFLTACYAHRAAVRSLAQIQRKGGDGDVDQYRSVALERYEEMRNSMSRMRLFGSDRLVAQAQIVQALNRAEHGIALGKLDFKQFYYVRREQQESFEIERDNFVSMVRRLLGVDPD